MVYPKSRLHTDTMETTTQTVKLIRNCFAEAKPYRAGEIASFSPRIANELISNRCAIEYTPPIRESATLPATAETTTLPTAKPARKNARK